MKKVTIVTGSPSAICTKAMEMVDGKRITFGPYGINRIFNEFDRYQKFEIIVIEQFSKRRLLELFQFITNPELSNTPFKILITSINTITRKDFPRPLPDYIEFINIPDLETELRIPKSL